MGRRRQRQRYFAKAHFKLKIGRLPLTLRNLFLALRRTFWENGIMHLYLVNPEMAEITSVNRYRVKTVKGNELLQSWG